MKLPVRQRRETSFFGESSDSSESDATPPQRMPPKKATKPTTRSVTLPLNKKSDGKTEGRVRKAVPITKRSTSSSPSSSSSDTEDSGTAPPPKKALRNETQTEPPAKKVSQLQKGKKSEPQTANEKKQKTTKPVCSNESQSATATAAAVDAVTTVPTPPQEEEEARAQHSPANGPTAISLAAGATEADALLEPHKPNISKSSGNESKSSARKVPASTAGAPSTAAVPTTALPPPPSVVRYSFKHTDTVGTPFLLSSRYCGVLFTDRSCLLMHVDNYTIHYINKFGHRFSIHPPTLKVCVPRRLELKFHAVLWCRDVLSQKKLPVDSPDGIVEFQNARDAIDATHLVDHRGSFHFDGGAMEGESGAAHHRIGAHHHPSAVDKPGIPPVYFLSTVDPVKGQFFLRCDSTCYPNGVYYESDDLPEEPSRFEK